MPDPPGLVTPIVLEFPRLHAGLEGLRILHVSDLHVRGERRRLGAILDAISRHEHDLMVVTGDSMVRPGDERAAAEYLSRLVGASRGRLGAVGVWGNHDTHELRDRAASAGVRWLRNSAWLPMGLPLTVLGVDCAHHEMRGFSGDLVAAMLHEAEQAPDDTRRFRLLLAHLPSWLPPAAACGVDLMLCGHTHGGQCRLPTGHALVNATPDWPLRYTSGTVEMGATRCHISPGLGETYVTGLRLFCKPAMPLITLRSRGAGAA